MGQVDVLTRSTNALRAFEAAREPVLILSTGANAEAVVDSEVSATAKNDHVIAQRAVALIEQGDGIERTATGREFGVGTKSTVVTVVTDTILKRPLFCR